jgi:hypothetical protein
MTYATESEALSAAYEIEVLDDCQVAVESTEGGWTLFVEPSIELAN